jgi:hypothetical protein
MEVPGKEDQMFQAIPMAEFRRRTHLNGDELTHAWGSVDKVVSLRDLASISAIQIMPKQYLHNLLNNVVLAGGNKERVYEGCKIHIISLSPKAAEIGQTFVERSKYVSILENVGNLVADFATASGALKLGAFIALGRTAEGDQAIAHYLPPIAEMNGGSLWKWLDGIHRGYLHVNTGSEIPTIAIEGVKAPFPCDTHGWDMVRPVDAKPPRDERFFNLKPDLFRDLHYVGIDG